MAVKLYKDLIFDIGMHIGQDTAFYLSKGFRVVAVEANPILANNANVRFSNAIKKGRLIIVAAGLTATKGKMPFYINKAIDEWSSFDRDVASRGHPIEQVDVETLTVEDLLSKYGVPYYAKIDIEGLDRLIVSRFIAQRVKPQYISYENPNPDLFELLVKAGYTRFKNISQSKVEEYVCPSPAREGRTIQFQFEKGSSGPFGEDSPGRWLSAEEMRPAVRKIEEERIEALKTTIYPDWFDMHASLDPPKRSLWETLFRRRR